MAPWFDYSWLLSVPKRCTRVTEGQLLTAGTQELLEPSRALLYSVPNPHSECDQARDSKGNTNTVLDSGCLSISSIPHFLKKEIKRRTTCGFLFSWDLSMFWEQNRVNYVASLHFFWAVELHWICKIPASHVMGRAECIFYSTIVTTLYHIAGKA